MNSRLQFLAAVSALTVALATLTAGGIASAEPATRESVSAPVAASRPPVANQGAATGQRLTPRVSPANPRRVWLETFENNVFTAPATLNWITVYRNTQGQAYWANRNYLDPANCNGIVGSSQMPSANYQGCLAQFMDVNRVLAYGVGFYHQYNAIESNHSLLELTYQSQAAGVIWQATDMLPTLPYRNRFLTARYHGGAVICQRGEQPLLRMEYSQNGTNWVRFGPTTNLCTSGQAMILPAMGTWPAGQTGYFGFYGPTADSFIFNGPGLGLRIVNDLTGGLNGNDFTVDNIQLFDVSPQLTKSFSPASIVAGQTSRLTFTITNTNEYGVKAGWQFTDTLPANLTVANPPAASTTCSSTTVTATAGSRTISVPSGQLNAGQAECTISLNVTSNTAGSYVNGASNLSLNGLVPPGNAPLDVVAQAPELTVTKSSSPTTYSAAGEVLKYTIVATNTGNVALSGVTVTDSKVPSLTCSPATPTSLAIGAKITCTGDYTVTQADVDAKSIANTATANGTAPDGTVVSGTASAAANFTGPGIAIDKVASPPTFSSVGERVTFAVTVRNSGTQALSNVTVTDPTLSDFVCSPATPVASLAVGAAISCQGSHVVTQADIDAGTITNSALANGTSPGGDSVAGSDDVSVPVANVVKSLDVVKTATPTKFVQDGDVISYEIVATNTGNVTLTGVTVTDPKVSNLTCTPTTPAVLSPGAKVTCSGSLRITTADVTAGSLTNTATAAGTDPQGGTVTDNGSTTATGDPANPRLSLSKSATPSVFQALGERVTFSIVGTNTGNVALTNVTLTDPLVTNLDCLPAVPVASLRPGGTITCTASRTVTQADLDSGSFTNTAYIEGTAPNGQTLQEQASTVVPGPTAAPALSLAKSVLPTSFRNVGDNLTYTLTATNTGNVTLSNVTVADPMLQDLTCAPATPATLAPNDKVTCTAPYSATQADIDQGSIANAATATGRTPSGSQLTARDSVSVPAVDPVGRLSVVKTGAPTTFSQAGELISYTITTTNTGVVTLSNVNVSDPKGSVSCTPALPVATLAPGAAIQCTLTYVASQSDVEAGESRNTATATGSDPRGGVIEGSGSQVVPGPEQRPDLSVVKTGPASFTAAGEPAEFTIVATNTGNVTLKDVTITDSLLTNLSCTPAIPRATLAIGASITCTATRTVTQADVDAGVIINTASARGKDLLGRDVSGQDTVSVPGPAATPSLSVQKSSSTEVVTAVGQRITFTAAVANTGNVTITGLKVNDPMLATPMTCPVTTLTPGQITNCTGSYITTAADLEGTAVINLATATGTPERGPEPAGSDQVSVPTATGSTLGVTKSVSPSTFSQVGQRLTYGITVTNNGSAPITNVTVRDPKLANLVCNPRTPVSSLAAGASITCQGEYTTTQADLNAGSVSNTASASGTGPGGTPLNGSASATALATGVVKSLDVLKTASTARFSQIGEIVAYDIVTTNTGNVTLSDVTVSDPRISNLACTPSIPTASLAPGASITCSGTLKITQADVVAQEITNTATATGKDPQGGNVSDSGSAVVSGPDLVSELSVAKIASPTAFEAVGERVTFTVVATNTGNVPLTNVTVSDPKIASLSCAPSTPVASLAPGAAITCTGPYTVSQADVDAGRFTNTATASGTGPSGQRVSGSGPAVVPGPTPNPKLSLAKSSMPTAFRTVGETLTYTLTSTNTGNVTLTGVTVTDPTVGGLTCSPSTPATLAPNEHVTCTGTYVVTQADVDRGTISNSASTTGRDPGSNPITAQASLLVPGVTPSSGLSVVKSSSPTAFTEAGQTLTYTVTATNTGLVTLRNVRVTDPQGTLSCTPATPVTTLAPGDAIRCTMSYVTTQDDVDSGTTSNTATATGADPQGGTIDNSGTATVPGPEDRPELSVVKTGPASFETVGDTARFTVTATNTGNVTLRNVSVTDSQLTNLACTPALPVTTLGVGKSIVCTGTRTITQVDVNAGTLTNTASATAKDLLGQDVSGQDTAAVPGPAAAPALSVVKSTTTEVITTAGQRINYSAKVTNTGNVRVTNVTIHDPLLSMPMTCEASALAPGQSTTCTGTYTTSAPDLLGPAVTNTATATGQPSRGATPSASDQESVPTTEASKIDVAKSVSPSNFAQVGQKLTFTVTATNIGTSTLTNVTVSDPKATELACSPTTPVASLAVGAAISCQGEYTVTQADINAGQVANTATASGTGAGGVSVSDSGSATATAATPVKSIEVTKRANPRIFSQAGDVITYDIVATNTGNVTLTGVTVTDPKVTDLVCSSPTPATLDPGASITCTATTRATQADVQTGTITNTASASGRDPQGGTVSDTATSSVAGPVLLGQMAVTKVASPVAFQAAGDRVTYTIVATNTGNAALTNVTVTDPKVTGLTCSPATPVASLPAGGAITCTGSYTVTQADVDAGVVNNVASAAGTGPNGQSVSGSAPATVPGPVARPRLSIAKTVMPTTFRMDGEQLTYTITATNTGNVSLANLTVSDPKASGLTCSPSSPVALLLPRDQVVCTGTYTVTQEDLDLGTINNRATARGVSPAQQNVSATTDVATRGLAAFGRLSVTKSAQPTTFVRAGEVVRYTVVATNTGTATLSDVTVTDPKGRLRCIPATPVATLAPQASIECTMNYTVTQADVAAGEIRNTATARGTDPEGEAVSGLGSATVPGPQAKPELSVVKTGPATFSSAGSRAQFTITVTNTGSVTLKSVTVSDPQLTGLLCKPGIPAATLEVGKSITCIGSRTVTQNDVNAGSITNTATASGKDLLGNAVSDQATVTVPGPAATPSIAVTKTTPTPMITEVGQKVPFTATVTNTGNVRLASLVVSDPMLPAPMTCEMTSLNPGQSTTCTGTYTTTAADLQGLGITNVATASATPSRGNAATASADAAVPTPRASGADLSILKTNNGPVSTGANAVFTLTVTNLGPEAATEVRVRDALPEGLTFVSASGSGWTCKNAAEVLTCTLKGTLAKGKTSELRLTVKTSPAASPKASNTATVSSAQGDPNPYNNRSTSTLEVQEDAKSADLSIRKTNNGPVAVGSQATFTLAVTNAGPDSATGVVVTDALPDGLTFVSATGTKWTCTQQNGNVTCALTGSLAKGATASVTITVRTTKAAVPQVTNTAKVDSDTPDPDPGNNTSSSTLKVQEEGPEADLALSKSTNGPVTWGQNAVFTVTVTNQGPATAADVVVTDTLPAGVTYVASSGSGWECTFEAGTVTCTRASLAAGASAMIQITVKTTEKALPSVSNTASVTSSTPDPDPSNNKDTAVLKVDKAPQRPATPNVVEESGNSLIVIPGVTNAGQQIKVKVVCTPMDKSAPAGDVEYCTVTRKADGSIRVVNISGKPITVKITYQAKGNQEYAGYREVEYYGLQP